MLAGTILFEILKSIPRFWDYVVRGNDVTAAIFGIFPSSWVNFFSINGNHGNAGMFTRMAIYFLLYIVLCVKLNKLAKIPLGLADRHMNEHNCALNFNGWLYVIAAAFFLFDIFLAYAADMPYGVFYPISYLCLLIAVIRMAVRVRWRAAYFLLLQCSVLAYLYVMALIAFPILVIMLAGVSAAGATSGYGKYGASRVCPRCGRSLNRGETCSCD